jgi:hypothetical protein
MAQKNIDPFEYDVALSFAVEDKAVAEEFANLLANRNIKVFRDEYEPSSMWGKDMIDHLVNIYARKARYCLLLISQYYPLRTWTEAERTSAQERAFRDADEWHRGNKRLQGSSYAFYRKHCQLAGRKAYADQCPIGATGEISRPAIREYPIHPS